MKMEILELNPSRPFLPLRHTGWFVELVPLIGNYKEFFEYFVLCFYFLLLNGLGLYESPDY